MQPPLQIVVDTRERRGWDFVGAVSAKLEAGDYSVAGLEHLVSVERKSLADLVQSLTRARARFFREIQILARRRFAAIVVEAGVPELLAGRYASGASPESLLGSCMAIHVDFGVPVVFAGDRAHARLWTERFLARAEARLNRKAMNPAKTGAGLGAVPVPAPVAVEAAS